MGSPTPDDDPTRPRPVPPDQGGWPPPGQGGWPPPGQYPGPQGGQSSPPGPGGPYPGQRPAPTAQFPAVGGYPAGPSTPGGPYPPPGPGYGPPPPGYGPPPPGYGPPPPGGGRGHRGLLIAVIAGLVVLAGLAVALVIAFTREGGETVAAERSGTTSDAPPSSSAPSSPTESPGSTASSEPSAAPSSSPAGDRTDELLAAVPADFTDCAPGEPAGDGDVAAVRCGPSTTRPGPQDGTFYLYEDTATLDRVFAEDAAGLDPMPEGADCSTAQGVSTWNVDGVEGGEVACTITGTGLLLAWTDREFGIEGIVTAPGSTQEELAALADWWTANSGYQG